MWKHLKFGRVTWNNRSSALTCNQNNYTILGDPRALIY